MKFVLGVDNFFEFEIIHNFYEEPFRNDPMYSDIKKLMLEILSINKLKLEVYLEGYLIQNQRNS